MAQPQLCTGCVAASSYVMWGHCVWRHLLTCCTPAAPSGTAWGGNSFTLYLLTVTLIPVLFLIDWMVFESWLWLALLDAIVTKTLSVTLSDFLSTNLLIHDTRAVKVCFGGKYVSMISYRCLSFSGSICAPSGVVYKAWPGPERGEWPQGGVGRSTPVGAQHFQRRCSCITTGGSREEKDFKCCGGEGVE